MARGLFQVSAQNSLGNREPTCRSFRGDEVLDTLGTILLEALPGKVCRSGVDSVVRTFLDTVEVLFARGLIGFVTA